MELKNQVCGLESAKKLKELRVKQDSLWYYRNIIVLEHTIAHAHDDCRIEKNEYSAFTVAELGELLPSPLNTEKETYYLFYHQALTHNVYYKSIDGNELPAQIIEETEAEARARMLIYLLENKLIKRIVNG